jgi:hypothetical protein
LPVFGLWRAISLQIEFEDSLESQAVILLARADGAVDVGAMKKSGGNA